MSAKWKLVPVEPTQEMVAEVDGVSVLSHEGRRIARDYMDMLASSPPASEDKEFVEALVSVIGTANKAAMDDVGCVSCWDAANAVLAFLEARQ